MEPAYLNRRDDLVGTSQTLRPTYPQALLNVNGQRNPQGYAAVSHNDKPGMASWTSSETQPAEGPEASASKRRRRLSPSPLVSVKDEPEEHGGFVRNINNIRGTQVQDALGFAVTRIHSNTFIRTLRAVFLLALYRWL
ncbi:hypothetical protein NHX12_002508 [Muraenolepis orangiensis]|uniref:Uncharacterized protein n=1 Tax=Muraenolepis orangiensis TaxID=630683 RepID=A0A9Q0DX65_9TELE|nr:hypothetical protein NHX12_002508 [Muraenolepis orangiensis]